MAFAAPAALILLLALIPVIWLGWPRLAYRRRRDRSSLILRSLILILLVLALAGAQAVRPADRLAIAFLVDVSDSVGGAARAAQLAFINDAVTALQPDDQAAVIAFGGDALIERPLVPARAFATLTALRSTPAAGNTDLEEAINLALALLPADAGRRIVILSDGEQTTGDALRAARRAAALGVAIDYARFQRERTPEIQLAEVRAPASVSAGQTFDLDLTINADQDGPAAISVYADGALLLTQTVDLRTGSNRYALALQAGAAGFSDFRVQVDPVANTGMADGFFQNNSLAAFSRVVGPPRVLIARVAPEETRYLADALRASGLIVDEAAPEDLPLGLAALETYDSIVLANVPAVALGEARMALLQTYIRDLGGGLVVTGGPQSYAPGGYFETPLEDLLPVEMQIRDQQRLPQLAIVYAIDRSGSMQAVGPSGVENIELAKEAIIRSIAFLLPTDRAGVVSFDTDGAWIAEIQPVLDRVELQALVGTLRASGGTDILAGMRLAGTALQTDPATRKHIVLLTDGGAPESGLIALTQLLHDQYGITTSVIAIGGAPSAFLARMAEVGGGNYHAVEVVAQIPTIFTQEAVLATRAYIIEAPFTPAFAAPGPILNGIDALPPLRGYVAAAPRTAAQTLLTSGAPYHDPILAAWQYGLGRAVAFTADVTARWAADWVTWPEFARFWDQAVRWTIVEGADANLEVRVEAHGESARLIVDARDDAGGFLNGLTLTAALIDPDLTTETLTLTQTAPGLYEAAFTPRAEGAYFIGVSGADQDGRTYTQTAGWVNSYSAEYALRPPDDGARLLADLAALTGGRPLDSAPDQAARRDRMAQPALTPLAPLLLLLALLLWPVDIAVRRLLITPSDLARLRAYLRRTLFGQRATVDTRARLTALREARARAAARTTGEAEPIRPVPPGAPAASPPARPEQPSSSASPAAPPPIERAEGENLASALLKRKRRE